MATVPRIALLIDTSTSWGSWIVQGVVRYVEQHGKHEMFQLAEAGPANEAIARVDNRSLADQTVRCRRAAAS